VIGFFFLQTWHSDCEMRKSNLNLYKQLMWARMCICFSYHFLPPSPSGSFFFKTCFCLISQSK